MNKKQHIELISAYVDGSITPEERTELNRLIDQGEIDILDVKETESYYQKMGRLPDPEPSEEMRARFYTMLEQEQKKQANSFSNILRRWIITAQTQLTTRRVAFALGVFLMGMLVGNWATPFQNYQQEISSLSNEVSQMREVMMLTMLDNKSANERLKAVNISSDIHMADDRIAEALLKTLNNDPNVNVRIAAVEALVKHASAPKVRAGLVASIGQQESPLIQAALADAMLALQERRSVDEFRQLLEEDKVNPGVRDKIENTIAALS